MENPTWKTKEGKEVFIKDMTDTHLKNTIKLLERKTQAEYPDVLERA
jgi:hypothetical protein